MSTSGQQINVREAILDATDILLARYGYRKMTIDDLAAEVGIGKGSIYLHFPSKEEIVLSHVDRIVERLIEKFKIITAKNISSEEKLREMIVERVIFRFDSVQHYTQNLNDLLAALRPKLLARRRIYFETEAAIFSEIIEEGRQSRSFNTLDSLETAKMILIATNSLLPYNLSAQELGERADMAEKTLNLANLLLNGLIKR